MFLVQNVRVALQKLPRFQGQTFQNVNSRMTIDQTEKFALGNVAVSAKQRVRFARETYIRVRITRVQAQSETVVNIPRIRVYVYMRIIKSTFASANSISLYQSDAPKWCAKCSRHLFSICASQQPHMHVPI